MHSTCTQCKTSFEISNEDQKFYEKIGVVAPDECPQCRLMHRLTARNARCLYYRKCNYSGKPIISQYDDTVPFPVYDQEIWWSDVWDAMDYGQEIQWGTPFFEQFKTLKYTVPHFSVFVVGGTMENSDYTNCTGYLKNCYLISESDYDEDCYYSNLLKKSKNLVDCSICYNDELCYQCIDCNDCYDLQYSQDSQNCSSSFFLSHCIGCKDCIGCINQRQKQYMILNEQYTKEEYEKKKASFRLNSHSGIEQLASECENFFKNQVYKNLDGENNQNVVGDHVHNSKNAFYCFDSKDLEDCRYCAKLSLGVKDSMDYNSWGDKAELIYMSAGCGDTIYNLKFCTFCTTNLRDCTYCDHCTSCSDCFGCVGLKKKQYCIFNKQYSKEEYFELKARLENLMIETQEAGKFFPKSLCPWGYNETIAMDYYPLTKEEAIARGFKWKDKDLKEYMKVETVVPDSADEIFVDMVSKLLACQTCGKNYKIIQQEFEFYKKMNIPIPRYCPDCRHLGRMKKRSAKYFMDANCSKCGKDMKTTLKMDGGKKVYCEECYLGSVY